MRPPKARSTLSRYSLPDQTGIPGGRDLNHALAESLGIAEHVTLPGRIMYRDLHAYPGTRRSAVAPKMSETEGAGKISNYLAMGLPVVAFDTPVSHDMLGHIGRYARYGDAQSLADEIIALMDDPREMEILSAASRARAIREHPGSLARCISRRSTSVHSPSGQDCRFRPCRRCWKRRDSLITQREPTCRHRRRAPQHAVFVR